MALHELHHAGGLRSDQRIGRRDDRRAGQRELIGLGGVRRHRLKGIYDAGRRYLEKGSHRLIDVLGVAREALVSRGRFNERARITASHINTYDLRKIAALFADAYLAS